MQTYKCLNKIKYKNGDFSLIPIRKKDIYKIKDWRNAQINILRQKEPLTDEAQMKYYNDVIKPSFLKEHPDQILFTYLYKNKCVGYGGLVHISWSNKKAELSFLLSPEFMQINNIFKKYFEEYIHLLLDIAFKDMKFRSIYTETYTFRTTAIKILENNGFKFKKIMKDRKLVNGKYFDSLIHIAIKDKHIKEKININI